MKQINVHKRALQPIHGFTLIELLVVVGIIGLLTAILVPTLSRARESARCTQCMGNLHSISQAMVAYISDHHGFFPPMATLPTIESPVSPRKAIPVLLGNYVNGQNKVFLCPSDRFIDPASVQSNTSGAKPPANVETWIAWQGSSYTPMYGLSIQMAQGKWGFSRENSLSPLLQAAIGDSADMSDVPLMFDYEQFHPIDGNSFAAGRMILFTDFRVAKGTNFVFKMDGLD